MDIKKILTKRGCLKSQFGCHIELVEILTIKLIAFDNPSINSG